MADLEVLGTLELLGWEENRGILQRWNDDRSKIEELVPVEPGTITLFLRRAGGKPFCVTIPESAFVREIYPDFELKAAAALGKSVEELRAEMPWGNTPFSTIPVPRGVDTLIPVVLPTSESPDGTAQGKEQSDVHVQNSNGSSRHE